MGSPQGVQRSEAEEGGRISHTASAFHLKEKQVTKENKQYILDFDILLNCLLWSLHLSITLYFSITV